jgi:hypothetical protein
MDRASCPQVRFYYVEDGARIKAERDRKRELELLRLSRSANRAQPDKESTGDPLSRASTPFSMGAYDALDAGADDFSD